MEAIILGTSAAEGIPALFCGCDACRSARAAGGKDIRARQSVFLPPDIVVDLGPDSLYAVHRFGLDWSALATVLYSHSHSDHCIPQELEYVRPVFANHRKANGLDIYGNENVRTSIQTILGEQVDLRLHATVPFQPIELPNATATPIPSHHISDGEETLNYIVSRGGKTMLFAWDTGMYDDETWKFLETVRIDALLIECTFGVTKRNPDWPYHLDLPTAAKMRDRLRAQGSLIPGGPSIITHFSHNGVLPYEAFQDLAGEYGLTVAYDGMRVVV
jgi:phosphoribosyl 1,2-cyclic phosphate phosphodiesterase